MTTVKAGLNITLKPVLETYSFNDRKTNRIANDGISTVD